MIHAKAMAVVVAYDIYLELSEGEVNEDWKTKPVDFFAFRETLAIQMLQYSPTNRKYPGDSAFRLSTQQPKSRRSPRRSRSSTPKRIKHSDNEDSASIASHLTSEDLEAAANRLCGRLDLYCEHVKSLCRMPGENSRVCVVCGRNCYEMCSKCGKALHYSKKQSDMQVPCFLAYHDTSFFGLSKEDWPLSGGKKKDWKIPDKETLEHHAEAMKELHIRALSKRHASSHNNSNTGRADNNNSNNTTTRDNIRVASPAEAEANANGRFI